MMNELILRLDGVVCEYRRGRDRWQVLSGVSLMVRAGEFVGVLGARGEGKTTLLEVAAGLRVPEQGTVWFDGVDLTRCSEDDRDDLLGDRIAWIPRDEMAQFRVLDSVALPLAMRAGIGMRAARGAAMEALKRVGAEGRADSCWEELSDWDRLLVTLARGYASHPWLIVIDDLLDALGAAGTRQVGELLRSIVQELGCGVLAAASDPGALLAADRVLRFNGEGGLSAAPSESGVTNLVDLRAARRASGG